jgi:hypothetical protein
MAKDGTDVMETGDSRGFRANTLSPVLHYREAAPMAPRVRAC